MSEREFWQTTPRYFDCLIRAYEMKQRSQFELTRTSSFLICSPHLKKTATLNRFWPSPWEKPKKIEWQPVDPAVLANFERNADDVLANIKRNGDN